MEFAKKILNKYGWKEGDGLGKSNNGISKPIKANLKFDNAGFGADQAASDFNNHWWERVYNEAASNVNVEKKESGAVSVDLKDHENGVEITTKGYSLKKLKKAKKSHAAGKEVKYNNFLQSATLTKAGDEVENPNKIEETDIAVAHYKVLTDEELFQACGGRTAHKGARHGLKLSGKLLRLEQQEQELLAKMLNTKSNDEKTSGVISGKKRKLNLEIDASNCVEEKKVHKKKKKEAKDVENCESTEEVVNIEKTKKKCKKKKKQK